MYYPALKGKEWTNWIDDVLHLIKNAKPDTDLPQATNGGLVYVAPHSSPSRLPFGGDLTFGLSSCFHSFDNCDAQSLLLCVLICST